MAGSEHRCKPTAAARPHAAAVIVLDSDDDEVAAHATSPPHPPPHAAASKLSASEALGSDSGVHSPASARLKKNGGGAERGGERKDSELAGEGGQSEHGARAAGRNAAGVPPLQSSMPIDDEELVFVGASGELAGLAPPPT